MMNQQGEMMKVYVATKDVLVVDVEIQVREGDMVFDAQGDIDWVTMAEAVEWQIAQRSQAVSHPDMLAGLGGQSKRNELWKAVVEQSYQIVDVSRENYTTFTVRVTVVRNDLQQAWEQFMDELMSKAFGVFKVRS